MHTRTILSLFLLASALHAQEDSSPSNAELARRIDLVSEMLQTQDFAAQEQPFSLGGYGELSFRKVQKELDRFDLQRLVFFFGYNFNEQWALHTELEYEHTDHASVEFAQIDGQFSEALNFRAGNLLIPVGLLNQRHEPTTFWSAQRPLLEQLIIPTTWHENGLGTFGRAENLRWQAYVVNGFQASGFNPSVSGLRGGRQNGSQAAAEDLAFTGRLEWQVLPQLLLGASAFQGDSGQGNGKENFNTQVYALHAEAERGPLRVRALYTKATVQEANLLLTPSPSDKLEAWYLEAGYDLFASRGHGHALIPFFRYESVDLLASTAADSALQIVVIGLAWQPQENLIFKLDWKNQSSSIAPAPDAVEFTLGWSF